MILSQEMNTKTFFNNSWKEKYYRFNKAGVGLQLLWMGLTAATFFENFLMYQKGPHSSFFDILQQNVC